MVTLQLVNQVFLLIRIELQTYCDQAQATIQRVGSDRQILKISRQIYPDIVALSRKLIGMLVFQWISLH
jgi:hypothetical protein